jgi:hypothetical protein
MMELLALPISSTSEAGATSVYFQLNFEPLLPRLFDTPNILKPCFPSYSSFAFKSNLCLYTMRKDQAEEFRDRLAGERLTSRPSVERRSSVDHLPSVMESPGGVTPSGSLKALSFTSAGQVPPTSAVAVGMGGMAAGLDPGRVQGNTPPPRTGSPALGMRQGLTPVYFSAQPEPFFTHQNTINTP